MKNKSNLFIGSSVEGLEIAESVKGLLEHSTIRAEIWNQGTFKANGYPLEQLEEALDKHKFGLFVMTPDDIVLSRGNSNKVARDNVLLELGMFIGRYGRNNCFILMPRGTNVPRMPSDLTGFNAVNYDEEWADQAIDAAMGTPVRGIKKAIEELEKNESPIERIPDLEEEQNIILKLLFNVPDGTKIEMLIEYLSIDKGLLRYHIDILIKNNHIEKTINEIYILTSIGRKYVVEVVGVK
jgi:hypothetical protein